MRKITLILGVFLFTITSYAQTSWNFQNPLPQGNDLMSVSFCDRTNGWAVGASGMVLRTSDGGTTWQIQFVKPGIFFYGVACLSPTTALVCGQAGTLMKTTDGGTTWNAIDIGTTNFISSMNFISPTVGYFAEAYNSGNNKFFKTTDAGNTWTSGSLGFSNMVTTLVFRDQNLGYVATGGFFATTSLYKTTNGGTTWTQDSMPTTYNINSISIKDTVAIAVGYDGVIIKTINNLGKWVVINAGNINTYSLNSCKILTPKLALATGEMGVTLRSTDGGLTWTTIMAADFTQYKTLQSVCMVDTVYGYLVGNKGKMMKTTDGGLTWNHMNNDVIPDFWAVYFTSTANGTAVGELATQAGGWTDGKIYTTTNGGAAWNLSLTTSNATYLSVHYPSTSIGYAIGGTGRNAIYAKTTDGGSSWSQGTINNFGGKLWGVYFFDNTNGCAVGDSGVVMTTADGANTWTKRITTGGNDLFGVYFAKDLPVGSPSDSLLIGYAVGANGTLLRSGDKGVTWTKVTLPTTNSLYSIYMVPSKAIWVVGYGNKIYKSTSNGIWTAQTVPGALYGNLESVWAVNENQAAIVGSSGILLRTSDGGNNWVQQYITTNELRGVHFENQNIGFVVGIAGTVLNTTNGGLTEVEKIGNDNIIPAKISLYQNYPNPFNPSTAIKFDLLDNSFVSLKVYDILGRQVASLINRELSRGSYSQTWNAHNCSSGIYIYQLKAEGTEVSRKMLLLK